MATEKGKPSPVTTILLYDTEHVKPLFKNLQLATITPDCTPAQDERKKKSGETR